MPADRVSFGWTMRRRLIAIVVLALGLAAGFRWLLSTGVLLESTRARLVDDARRSLGREVTVDRISGDPYRGLVLTGVRVRSPAGVATGDFFTAPRITVYFDSGRLLRDLAARRGVIASITRIDLERPFLVLARDSRGRWNFSDLFARKPGAPAQPPAFRGTVELREGSFAFSDALRLPRRAGPNPPSPFASHFDRITGTLDFRAAPQVGLVLDAVNTDGRTPALLRATGKTILGEGTFDFDVDARGGSVDFWGPYLVRLPWLDWSGGTFDGRLHLLASRWGQKVVLDYRGNLVMRDGKAVLPAQATVLSNIDGPMSVDNLGITTDGMTMAVDASPLWVRGTVMHHAGVHLDLALRSEVLDLRTLQRLFFPRARVQLAGRMGGEARVVGPLGVPRLEGEIAHASGSINRQPFTDASGRFNYYGGVLVFDDMSAASAGGRLLGHARLNFNAGSFFLLADARSVDTQGLSGALNIAPTLRGRASGVIAAAGAPGSVIAQGRVEMDRGQAMGVGFDRLETIFGYDAGRVDLYRLEARSGPTRVHASGKVSRSGALDLSLTGTAVNLSRLADRFGLRRWLAGTADVQGRVQGSFEAPELVGTVRGRQGQLGPFPFDEARGRVRVTTTGLQTPGLVLFDGPGRYFAAGEIRWAEPSRVNLTARAADVPAQRLLEIADIPVRLSGTVESTVRLSGPMHRPLAEGTMVMRNGRIEGQPVDQAEASFRWTGSDLLLDQFTARANSSLIEARGSVSRAGQLGITFSAAGLDLKDIAVLRTNAFRAAGHIDLNGTLGGTVQSPSITAAVLSSDLVLNDQDFTRAEGAVQYRQGRLQFAPLTLSQDGGFFSLSGVVVLRDDPVVDVQIAARQGQLATLLGFAGIEPPFALTGAMDGAFSAFGPISSLRASLNFNLTDGRIGDHQIRQASVGATLQNNAIMLRTFRVVPAQGELVGAGRIDLRGKSEVEFGGKGLSLDLLRPLFGIPWPLAGALDFTLQLSGDLDDPLLGLSADATDGTIRGVPFDKVSVQAFYRNGQLNVEHGLWQWQEQRHKARLTGTVPFDVAHLQFDAVRPVNMRLELVDSDLTLLGLLTDKVERAEGRLAGEVAISGTVARPHMEGTLTATNGTIKLRGIDPPLTAVAGQVMLREDSVQVVNRLSARMGDGDVSLSGSLTLSNFLPNQFALQLTADGARVEYPQVFIGAIDTDLRITGTAGRPALAGTARLSSGDLFVTSLRDESTGDGQARLNPTLNVEIAAGDALWVNVGSLRLQVHGTVRATQTWEQPELAGEVTAGRGTFVAFSNTFTLTEGTATFSPFRGTTPVIDAWAETRANIIRLPSTTTAPPLPGAPPSPPVTPVQAVNARVLLHITGPADDLTLVLSSDPPFSRDEIIAGLARQVGVTRLLEGESLENVLRAELGNALFGTFGRAVARTFGFEEFAIEYDFSRPLTLRIGKLLIKNLYVTLTSEFGVPRRNVWGLEWRLTPNTMFAFSVDSFSKWDFQYRITYRF